MVRSRYGLGAVEVRSWYGRGTLVVRFRFASGLGRFVNFSTGDTVCTSVGILAMPTNYLTPTHFIHFNLYLLYVSQVDPLWIHFNPFCKKRIRSADKIEVASIRIGLLV